MSSIIQGYEYDIFISYRQKDNKYDGWVSEFVENLRRELEATFKEEVSVYFDINSHDGLLETHDVSASLKEKLKCLVCIPIISLTYCDPKSYAWEYEFKAFIEQASKDHFGLKVTLPGGNVANRMLPVRIHDLDAADIKLFESTLGGVLRSIDFVYKETGVNRQLRSKDDNIIKNPNQILYRDQINKVAHAIKDILESIKAADAPVHGKSKEIQPKESIKHKVSPIDAPVQQDSSGSQQQVMIGKNKPERVKRLPILRKPGILIPGILIIIAIFVTLFFLINQHSKVRWAQEVALPEIEQFINNGNTFAAYSLLQKAEKYIPKEPKLKELSSLTTSKLTFLTDPPGADVYIIEYSDTSGQWLKLGRTPLDSAKIPGSSFWQASASYLIRFEKPGYENILAVTSTTEDTLSRKLFRDGEIPPGMVYVEKNNGFFIDRFEVTNKQYKEFIDKGGYSNPDYWKNQFKKDGKIVSREVAMALFVDNTGRPGPATWEAGYYPDMQDNYPVSGISWYEACAYAEYAGKDLPTAEDWNSAAKWFFRSDSKIVSNSNFNRNGPDKVGKYHGVTMFGAYDMAGNVREWCWNETPVGRLIRGGAWNDATYLYKDLSQLPSFDRSPKNGFRCIKYFDKEKIPESAFQQINYIAGEKDFRKQPVPDNIFSIYKNQFLYDSADLKSVIENHDKSSDRWITEKVSFNAAYENERMIAYLFLPENASPPFQTLIFFPGTGARFEKDIFKSIETIWLIDYLIKSGRAVMCPVYIGTFDRIDNQKPDEMSRHQFTERVIKLVKDFRRSVDYLETRPDIDKGKLGYYGFSWGGMMGGIIPAVEGRLKVNILIVGGLGRANIPEIDQINYLPRIKIPTLMLNGKYDFAFPYDKAVLPFYNLLGTPEKNKRHVVYETDHFVPKNEMIKETLTWLDRYLGPVK
jgi:formylglycine-generating enzyme required for sulfatase activity/dienelactone hydrolase